jgi:hypothetical protein
MRSLWRFFVRVLFWDYERGTVPYDLMVLAVVLWLFLAPRQWFNDRPISASGPHTAEVQLVSEDSAARTRTYRIDAHLLAPAKPDPQWERKAHDLLGKNVDSLRGRAFRIVKVETGRDASGSVLYYDISIQ